MDRVVIIGTYEFLGFSLCTFFLEQGIEVTGIPLLSSQDGAEAEEKRLEIGRNANFVELNELSVMDQSVIYIDYYSFYMKNREPELLSFLKKDDAKGASSLIGLLPIQLFEKTDDLPLTINQRIYLPTLYGPRQPEFFSFQQKLRNPNVLVSPHKREWCYDALFIDDVVHVIAEFDFDEQRKDLIFCSENHYNWEAIAEKLNIKKTTNKVNPLYSRSENHFHVVNNTDWKQGILQQASYLLKSQHDS